MNIKTSSWHYKIMPVSLKSKCRIRSRDNTLTLCWYFWQVVLSLLHWIGVTVVGIAALLCVGFIFVSFISSWVYGVMTLMNLPTAFFDPELISMSIILNILAMIVGFAILVIEGFQKLRSKNRNKEKEPSLFMSYVSAKKQKVCPIVKLED